MELNDILEKLSLPQDLTRRGFLKAASAAAALGLLNDARATMREPKTACGRT